MIDVALEHSHLVLSRLQVELTLLLFGQGTNLHQLLGLASVAFCFIIV